MKQQSLDEYFKPNVETYCSEKNSLNIILLIDHVPGRPRAPVQMYNEINVIFLLANTTCTLQPVDYWIFHPLQARSPVGGAREATTH